VTFTQGKKQLQGRHMAAGRGGCSTEPNSNHSIFVQSLNESIDLSERRLAALENRIPGVLWIVAHLYFDVYCLLVGYSMRRRALLVMLLWPLMISSYWRSMLISTVLALD